MSTSISELEFFDCGAANIVSTDLFTPKQIVYHARTQVCPPPPFADFGMRKTPLFQAKIDDFEAQL